MRDGLANVALFSDLAPEDRAAISAACAWQDYAKGREIIGHLDRSADVFFVVTGEVEIVVYTPQGREVIFRHLAAGQHFGEFAAIDGRPRSASAVAVRQSRIARLGAGRFRQLLDEHPRVKDRLLRQRVGLARQMTDRIFEFSALAVQNRVQAEILRLSQETGLSRSRGWVRVARHNRVP